MKVYQNRRIARALCPLLSAPVTVVTAPPGYGKTIQTHAFLSKRRSVETLWVGEKSLPEADSPVRRETQGVTEFTVSVLDDADRASAETVRRLLDWAEEGSCSNRRLVLLGRTIPEGLPWDWLSDSRFAFVGKRDLSLTRDEAAEWFEREGGCLTPEIWELCGGWPALLELCLRERSRPYRVPVEAYLRERVLPSLPSVLQAALAALAREPEAYRSRKTERLLAAFAEDGPLDWDGTAYRFPSALQAVLAREHRTSRRAFPRLRAV